MRRVSPFGEVDFRENFRALELLDTDAPCLGLIYEVRVPGEAHSHALKVCTVGRSENILETLLQAHARLSYLDIKKVC